MREPEKTQTLAQALLAAQREMPAVEPDALNPHFKSKFVSLDHLLATVLPVLNRNGVTLVQMPSTGERGEPALTTTLLHESGEQISSQMPLILPKNDPQGQGSALTYARRYALSAALGISAERDDDAQSVTDQVVLERERKEDASRSERMRVKIHEMCAGADELRGADTGVTFSEVEQLIDWRHAPGTDDENIRPYSAATSWDTCTDTDLEWLGAAVKEYLEQGCPGSLYENNILPF